MKELIVADLISKAATPLLSLEFFPPKNLLGFGMLGSTLEIMRSVHPDFVSITYGAGGSGREYSMEASKLLRKLNFSPVVAHLTCVGYSKDDLTEIIQSLYEDGIRNIMCLRGDPPQGCSSFKAAENGLSYASDLVTLVKELHPDICCGVAGYPEKHTEAVSLEKDIEHLKIKMDAGASFVTTQLFFENDVFYRYRDLCVKAGISIPIIPGIMPALSIQQIHRMISMTGTGLPVKLIESMEHEKEKPAVMEAMGLDWMVQQICGLLDTEVPGIHLYILNRAATLKAPALMNCLSQWRR